MRRALRAALAGAATAALVLAVAAPASAHNYVTSSTPAEGETLTELPEAWRVVTNDTLLYVGNDAVFGLWVRDADGLYYGDGCVDVSGPEMTAVPVIGAAGEYSLVYALISADGHPLSGEIPFTWAPADATAEPATGTTDPVRCGTEAEPGAAPPPSTEAPAGDDTIWWILAAAGGVALAVVAGLLIGRPRRRASAEE